MDKGHPRPSSLRIKFVRRFESCYIFDKQRITFLSQHLSPRSHLNHAFAIHSSQATHQGSTLSIRSTCRKPRMGHGSSPSPTRRHTLTNHFDTFTIVPSLPARPEPALCSRFVVPPRLSGRAPNAPEEAISTCPAAPNRRPPAPLQATVPW